MLALVPLVLVLAACTGGDEVVARERAGVRTFVNPPATAGFTAQIAGRLARTDGRCLSVVGTEGRSYVVIWPHGVTQTDEGVEVPGAGRIDIGDSFEAAGGYVPADTTPVPADCLAGADPDEIATMQRAETLRRVPAPTPTPRGVRAFVAPPTTRAGLAIIVGELVPTEGRCLAVSVGGEPYVVLWPAGVTPTDEGVDVPGVGRLLPGDVLRAGGGYHERTDLGAPVPADCWAAGAPGRVAVVGSVGSIRRG